MTIEHLQPPGDDLPTCLVLRSPVQTHEPEHVVLADADEVATFVVQKRCDEHLTGRWLLQEALALWGIDATLVSVERTKHRAPYLAYIAGVWKNTPLPSISLCHSGGWAYVAIAEPEWCVGLDGEPSDRGIQPNAFSMMAKEAELEFLLAHPSCAIEAWVSKEAIQKSLGLGMHLNPRKIEIPIGVERSYLSIEKSKIQLVKWAHKEASMAIAFTAGIRAVPTPEDALLEATRKAMTESEWGVGCKTTRGNA